MPPVSRSSPENSRSLGLLFSNNLNYGCLKFPGISCKLDFTSILTHFVKGIFFVELKDCDQFLKILISVIFLIVRLNIASKILFQIPRLSVHPLPVIPLSVIPPAKKFSLSTTLSSATSLEGLDSARAASTF